MSKSTSSRVVIDDRSNGHENMRRDLEMFAAVEEKGGCLARIYCWDGPWVSLGRSQNPERVLKDSKLVPWVMRPTGGGGVLHGHDLTVSIARSLGSDQRKLKDIYRLLVVPLVNALRNNGVDAILGEEHPAQTRQTILDDCFLSAGANDVVHAPTGTKLIGVAMKVTRRAVFAQCSIPISDPLVDPAVVFNDAHVPNPLPIGESVLVSALVSEIERHLT